MFRIDILAIIAVIVALAFGGLLWLEKRHSARLADDLAKAEQVIEAAKINRKALIEADKSLKQTDQKIDEAVRASETLEDAVDAIERLEGRR